MEDVTYYSILVPADWNLSLQALVKQAMMFPEETEFGIMMPRAMLHADFMLLHGNDETNERLVWRDLGFRYKTNFCRDEN